MWHENSLKDKLIDYKLEGDVAELCAVVYSNSLAAISAADIISILSKAHTNYIKVGYGDTLFNAYDNGYAKGKRCKLVHIYFTEDGMNIRDLNRFVCGFEEDIIFGYTKDETINSGVKLGMIFS